MSIGFGRSATHDLSRVGLVLLPSSAGRQWLVRSVLLVGAFSAGAGVGYTFRGELPPVVLQPLAAPRLELASLQQQLEQTRAALRLADAHGDGLEQQIDALNHRLRESTDQLTFFRKAREGRHP